jgi:phosphatidylserine decarboxylase
MIVACILLVAGFFLQFYRDPEREIPQQEGIIVSPADGKVIEIGTVKAGEIPLVEKNGTKNPLPELAGYIETEMTLVVIFMNPFDVHVNRAPLSGTIRKITHVPGKFMSASTPVYTTNERNVSVIEGEERVVVIQVAGMLVHRIRFFKHEGDFVERGERIGMIVFGSQVVAIFPEKYEVVVSVGNKVYAGETILASNSKPSSLIFISSSFSARLVGYPIICAWCVTPIY